MTSLNKNSVNFQGNDLLVRLTYTDNWHINGRIQIGWCLPAEGCLRSLDQLVHFLFLLKTFFLNTDLTTHFIIIFVNRHLRVFFPLIFFFRENEREGGSEERDKGGNHPCDRYVYMNSCLMRTPSRSRVNQVCALD